MSETDDIETLFQRYISGKVDRCEQGALEDYLRKNAENRRAFVERVRLESNLFALYKSFAAVEAGDRAIAPGESNLSVKVNSLRTCTAQTTSRNAIFVKAACLLFFLSSIYMIFLYKNANNSSSEPSYPPLHADVRVLDGEVFLVRKGLDIPVLDKQVLQYEDRLRISSAGAAAIEYEDGTRVTLLSNAEASFPKARGKTVRLNDGLLRAKVKSQQVEPMIFRTPHAEAVVMGTELSLEAKPEGTRLKVKEGQVFLKELSQIEELSVGSGQFIDVGHNAGFVMAPVKNMVELKSYYLEPEVSESDLRKNKNRTGPVLNKKSAVISLKSSEENTEAMAFFRFDLSRIEGQIERAELVLIPLPTDTVQDQRYSMHKIRLENKSNEIFAQHAGPVVVAIDFLPDDDSDLAQEADVERGPDGLVAEAEALSGGAPVRFELSRLTAYKVDQNKTLSIALYIKQQEAQTQAAITFGGPRAERAYRPYLFVKCSQSRD